MKKLIFAFLFVTFCFLLWKANMSKLYIADWSKQNPISFWETSWTTLRLRESWYAGDAAAWKLTLQNLF